MRIATMLIIYCLTVIIYVHAQDNLYDYLVTHRYSIATSNKGDLSFSKEAETMLIKRMEGKVLFIYGEGGSHSLLLNSQFLNAFIRLFDQHHLKYIFKETGRASAMVSDLYFQSNEASAVAFYPGDSTYKRAIKNREAEKEIYTTYGPFLMKGIDFERRNDFHNAMLNIARKMPSVSADNIAKYAPYMRDTAYCLMQQKEFLKFYKESQQNFFRDSTSLKPLLGVYYEFFKYLMSDPDPCVYYGNRNKNMADHILDEIQPVDHNAIYMLDCGQAHARPGKKDGMNKTTANLLSTSSELKGRIVVSNLYCEQCKITDEPVSNDGLDFMTTDILKDFQQAAKTDLTLYDLTAIPSKYAYIKEDYGAILIFARNSN